MGELYFRKDEHLGFSSVEKVGNVKVSGVKTEEVKHDLALGISRVTTRNRFRSQLFKLSSFGST